MRVRSLAVIVLALALAPSAGATTGQSLGVAGDPTPGPPGDSTPDVNRTAASEYRITIGDGGARMVVLLNTSLFARLPGPGQLRFSSYGLLSDREVVRVDLGVRFAGIRDPLAFVVDPFSRFDLYGSSELSLPFPTDPDAVVGPADANASTRVG